MKYTVFTKRTGALFLCAAMCLPLSACGSSGSTASGSAHTLSGSVSQDANLSAFDLDDYKDQVAEVYNMMHKDAELVSTACDLMDIMWSLSPEKDSSLAISSVESAFGENPEQAWSQITNNYKSHSDQYFDISSISVSGDDAEAIYDAYRTYFGAYTSLYTLLTAPPDSYEAFESVYKDATDDYNNSLKTLSNYLDISIGDIEEKENEDVEIHNDDSDASLDSPDISSKDEYSSSTDDVEIKAIPANGEDNVVCVFLTNNSDATIDELSVQINYKDKNGNIIDLDEDGHDMVLPGSTVVSRMDAPDSYADFEVETDSEFDVNPTYINHAADVDIRSNQGDECIIVEIQNNSDVTIEELEYVVVLYNDGQLVTVDYPEDIYDITSGDKVIEKVDTYDYKYDSFEVYLNQAHTF